MLKRVTDMFCDIFCDNLYYCHFICAFSSLLVKCYSYDCMCPPSSLGDRCTLEIMMVMDDDFFY